MRVSGTEESNTLQCQPCHRRGPSRLLSTAKHRAPTARVPSRSHKPTGLWTDYSANFHCSLISLSNIDFSIQKAKGCRPTAPEDCFMISALEPFTNYWSKSNVTKSCSSPLKTYFLSQTASAHYIEEIWLLIKVKDLIKGCQDNIKCVTSKHSQKSSWMKTHAISPKLQPQFYQSKIISASLL